MKFLTKVMLKERMNFKHGQLHEHLKLGDESHSLVLGLFKQDSNRVCYETPNSGLIL
jgi:hypothetical protein